MAIQVLGGGYSHSGSESCSWQVDYDDVAQTIGHTCTGQGTLILTVTVVATQATFGPRDVTGDLNQGRIVDFSNVPASIVPVHVKGQPYPLQFTDSWTP